MYRDGGATGETLEGATVLSNNDPLEAGSFSNSKFVLLRSVATGCRPYI